MSTTTESKALTTIDSWQAFMKLDIPKLPRTSGNSNNLIALWDKFSGWMSFCRDLLLQYYYTGDYRNSCEMIAPKTRHNTRYSPAGEYNNEDTEANWRRLMKILPRNF